MNYDIQYKGKVRHENIPAKDVVDLVSLGEISGGCSYSPTGLVRWRPVCQMVCIKNDADEWEIRHQPKREREAQVPDGTKVKHFAQHPAADRADAAAGAPSPVSVIINAAGQDAASAGRQGSPAGSRAGELMSIGGITIGLLSPLCAIGTVRLTDQATNFAVLGLVVGVVGIIVSAFGVHFSHRRALGFAGMLLGVLAMLGWAAFLLLSSQG